MDADDGLEDEEPLFAWLPPEDRLWRHPSEQALVASGHQRSMPWSAPGAGRRVGAARTATVAVLAGVVGALVASGVGMATGTFARQTTVVQSLSHYATSDTVALSTSAGGTDWPSITDQLSPAVVGVRVDSPSGAVTGSGVVYASGNGRSYVLTDEHLVDQGGPIAVALSDGSQHAGHLVAADPVTGIAVLWVPGSGASDAYLGSVADLRVAQSVMTIGTGSPDGQVYPGTIASLDKEVQTSNGSTMDGLIALAANTGSAAESGGAVVDSSGAVVGIGVDVDPTDPSQQNLTFAVPIDTAVRVASEALDGQPITHPWMGVADGTDLPSATAHKLAVPGGVQVGLVTPQSPAARAGLGPNDVILEFAGKAVTTTGSLVQALAATHPDQRVPITYLTNGTQRSASVVMGSQRSASGSS